MPVCTTLNKTSKYNYKAKLLCIIASAPPEGSHLKVANRIWRCCGRTSTGKTIFPTATSLQQTLLKRLNSHSELPYQPLVYDKTSSVGSLSSSAQIKVKWVSQNRSCNFTQMLHQTKITWNTKSATLVHHERNQSVSITWISRVEQRYNRPLASAVAHLFWGEMDVLITTQSHVFGGLLGWAQIWTIYSHGSNGPDLNRVTRKNPSAL